jgi:hypothetical protein
MIDIGRSGQAAVKQRTLNTVFIGQALAGSFAMPLAAQLPPMGKPASGSSMF